MADAKTSNKTKQGSLTAGFIVFGIGMIFLLSNLDLIPGIDDMWPLFLIVVGAALVIGAIRKRDGSQESTPLSPTESTTPPTVG